MAQAGLSLVDLPPEILLHILSFLEPAHVTHLQLVSKYFRGLGRDARFWKSRCFEESSFLEFLTFRRSIDPVRRALSDGTAGVADDLLGAAPAAATTGPSFESRKRERARIMANWDPAYPSERVNWYEEYIQRHGPIAVNWMQQLRRRKGSYVDCIEARGVALYRPDDAREEGMQDETLLAVSPLDDGGICIWDVNGTRTRKGAILAQSQPGILFIDGPGADNTLRSKRVDSGVTECVSVDSRRHRAFFAVQSHLIEVDLQRLCVVDCTSFPWSITTLSAADPNVPLTVGTTLGIHLHDYRARAQSWKSSVEGLDEFDRLNAKTFYERSLRAFFDDTPLPPMLSLSQPGPLSILHLQKPGSEVDLSDDIYVAGRFSNILHYDRRKFESIRGSIHSGARLCSLTSLPYPSSTVDNELRRKGCLTLDQVGKSKTIEGGRTLIACGEYNTKGSLEIYGLSSNPYPNVPGGLQNSGYKNRQTSASSKLLSVVNHGTRIAFSDGSGNIKWFERDGFTEVRHFRIGHSERHETPSLFASMEGSDDIARKLLTTRAGLERGRINNDDLLFWTGNKLGLVSFSSRPAFQAEDFEDKTMSVEEEALAREAMAYSERMRRALERQADSARMVPSFW